MTVGGNFISDDMVGAALAYLAQDPHPAAIAKAEAVHAENRRKRTYSKLFLSASGKTVAEREAMAETNQEYESAQSLEVAAIKNHEAERARVTNAQMVCELWRTVQSNNRAAERIR